MASRQDKTATYMNVMRDLRLANRNPVLDYLLVHFTQPDEVRGAEILLKNRLQAGGCRLAACCPCSCP